MPAYAKLNSGPSSHPVPSTRPTLCTTFEWCGSVFIAYLQQENSPFGFFKKLAEEKTKEAKEALENMDLKDLKIPTDKTPGNKVPNVSH